MTVCGRAGWLACAGVHTHGARRTVQVKTGSVAESAGLQVGDVVVRVGSVCGNLNISWPNLPRMSQLYATLSSLCGALDLVSMPTWGVGVC